MQDLYSPLCVDKYLKTEKKEITFKTAFTHFNLKLLLLIATDVSLYGIATVLSHVMADSTDKPIGFVQRTLTNTGKNIVNWKRSIFCYFW